MDCWKEFVSNLEDPSGTGGKLLSVTTEMLKDHSTPDDLWILLDGKVYNITHYLRFHPGGSEALINAIGKDGKPAVQCHIWVNCHSILERCLVGYFVDQPSSNEGKPNRKANR
ncbi:cytochrome b5-like Heme/Steroid binding domain protein [Trichuris suis]|uniref:Cytochrome b5 heme-binding domain-containing protein n=1 Tax=Trichuris suis TaxID=68888 RepID=A0A085M025_9BILA|nr:hypothetical protein M513_08520 [Trichuris suis]KHJ45328.1 cytochrome b5-like Heme/Steroid binding domain protein [Trichuris suis]